MTRRDTCLVDSTEVFKSIGVVYLLQFQELGILPVGVSIISTKHRCLLIITINIHPKLDLHCVPFLLRLGSLDEDVRLLSVLHIAV